MKITNLPKAIVTPVFIMSIFGLLQAQQLAFPTAEGFGKYTVGGRGGKVYEVTNLKDSGPGSLRDGLAGDHKKTIVFRVSGTIDLQSPLKVSSNTTIAGQTAPGDGICLKRYHLAIRGNQIIIRYIRVRYGDESGIAADAITAMRGPKNLIFDHVSASWSVDETMSVYHCMDVTVQWCMVTESLYNSNHTKPHGYGGIWGGPNGTFHHNLLAHHTKRNARICGAPENTDFRNNVIYNWGFQSTYGGEGAQTGSDEWKYSAVNIVNNYYKQGPSTLTDATHYRILEAWTNSGGYGKFYITGNYMTGYPDITKDNWNGGVQMSPKGDINILKLDQPSKHDPIRMQTAEEAYKSVLEHAGCSIRRDAVDTRIIDEVRNGYATYEGPSYENDYKVADKSKKCGVIDSQDDVGGWPELKSLPAPPDSDHDGMPDSWETLHKLNPDDAKDGNEIGSDGYTNLEHYLNSLVNVATTAVTPSTKSTAPHQLTLTKSSQNTITFSIPKKSSVKLEFYNISGKKVTTLVDDIKKAGNYSVNYAHLDCITGSYVCRLTTENGILTKNMFIIR